VCREREEDVRWETKAASSAFASRAATVVFPVPGEPVMITIGGALKEAPLSRCSLTDKRISRGALGAPAAACAC